MLSFSDTKITVTVSEVIYFNIHSSASYTHRTNTQVYYTLNTCNTASLSVSNDVIITFFIPKIPIVLYTSQLCRHTHVSCLAI